MRKYTWFGIALILLFVEMEGMPASAQNAGTFHFCIVQLRDAGDPLVDQDKGLPGHWYFSGIYSSDADKSQQFLQWARGHYGRNWTFNLSHPERGIASFCRSYSSMADARKALGSPASDGYQSGSNAYFTHTGWPEVPVDKGKKR
jgi:hypothetical protein